MYQSTYLIEQLESKVHNEKIFIPDQGNIDTRAASGIIDKQNEGW